MAVERREGNSDETQDLAMVTARITIELGIRGSDGARGITTLFEDLQNSDEDGDPQLLGYFDGKMMLGCASDEFFAKHFLAEDE